MSVDLDRARVPGGISNEGAYSPAWAEILGYAIPDSVAVTDANVRGLPALNRAKSLVVNSVATMLVAANVTDDDARKLDKPNVIRRPHPLLTAFEFFEQVADSLVMHGNYVAIRVRDGDDMQLIPVPLTAVSVDSSSGLPVYTIGSRTYSWRDIFHCRANAPVGTYWGCGVVETFRRALSEQLHSQSYGESSLRSGSVPSISVELDVDTPTVAQVDAAKAGFVEKFGGGTREPLVHGRALKLTPLSWSPHDAEFIESRRITLAEAALMVGLRPEDIGATLGSSLTYGNRSDDALQRIIDGYAPWMARIEGPLCDLLAEGIYVNGDPEALLRVSTRERLEIRELKQRIGVETPDESRAAEGYEPITEPMPEPTPDDDEDQDA